MPGFLVVCGQADLARAMADREVRGSPPARMAVPRSRQAFGAVGFIAICLAYWNSVFHRVGAQEIVSKETVEVCRLP